MPEVHLMLQSRFLKVNGKETIQQPTVIQTQCQFFGIILGYHSQEQQALIPS